MTKSEEKLALESLIISISRFWMCLFEGFLESEEQVAENTPYHQAKTIIR